MTFDIKVDIINILIFWSIDTTRKVQFYIKLNLDYQTGSDQILKTGSGSATLFSCFTVELEGGIPANIFHIHMIEFS